MSLSEASGKIRMWRKNPVQFVRDNFSVEPDEWQKDALMAAASDRRTAMKACKGPGKTCVLAWIAWWFLTCFLYPKLAAISISRDNLVDGFWAEMSKWQVRSPLLVECFNVGATRIDLKADPKNWFMSARSWSKSASKEQQANALAGLHADNIMFILDEAGGIPDGVAATAEAVLANDMGDGKKTARIVMAGNPTHNEGPLYRACTSEAELWKVIEITSDPDNPKRTPRVSIEWAREQIKKYGKDNPWVLVNVYGRFPPSSINSLLGPDEVEESMHRLLHKDAYITSQKRLGMDVARFGDDASVIAPRQGLAAFNMKLFRNLRSHELGQHLLRAKKSWGSEIEVIDGTGGYGSGVIDFMIQLGHSPLEYQGAGKAIDEKYANQRAECWFEMAEWVKRGGRLPKDLELKAELVTPTYTFDKSGRFLIEPKDQIKDRLGRSPDRADALSMTFLIPEAFASDSPQGKFDRMTAKSSHDWDPFADRSA